ncbi:hypothetical protein D7Y53_22485, partial [Stenotrophomonas maltophilia]|nr:hypothetical protein [Stenotrophomonas maltophilia]
PPPPPPPPPPPTLRKPAVAVASAVAVALSGCRAQPCKRNPLAHGHCTSPLATFALSSSDATPSSFG